jgi:hypothetical protein
VSILDENLKVLREIHFEISKPVFERREESDACLTLSDTPSGYPTARYHGTYLHSRYDPRKEAASLIRREIDPDVTTGILFGFGLGYTAEEFLGRFPSIPLLIVEPDVGLFHESLAARDLRRVLGSGGVRFMVGTGPEETTAHLEELPMEKPQFIRLRSEIGKKPAFFLAVEEIVRSYILRRDININTLGRFGGLWVRNLGANMRVFLESPGVALFTGLFQGLPSLLLAGGPSLDDILPILGRLRERLLVISVDTSLSPCLSAGVKPDFLVMVDPQYWASRYLDWTGEYDGFIVAEPSTHPRIFRHRGNRFILSSSLFPLGGYFESLVGEKGKLGAGGSVSTSAWDLCRLLGTVPVYTAGLDLGFPRLGTHCKGAFFEELWLAVSERLSPAEGRSFRYLREIGIFPMPSNADEPTFTDRRMLLYKWWFESQLTMAPETKSFTLSPRAVAIKGMGLAQADDLLSLPPIRKELDARMAKARELANAFSAGHSKVADALKTAIDALLSELKELETLSRHGLLCTRELSRLIARRGRCDPVIARLDGIDRRILEISSRNIAGFLIQPLIHRITGANTGNASESEVLAVSGEMYEGIAESARFHLSVLSRARNLLA